MPFEIDMPDQEKKNVSSNASVDSQIFLNIKKNTSISEDKISQDSSLLSLFYRLNEWFINQSKIKLQDKLVFFQLLSATHNAGITLQESLQMIGDQTKDKRFRRVIFNIKNLVEEGDSLATAFKRNSDVFDKTTYTIVEAGEQSGKLDLVLNQLVEQYERIALIQKKVMGMLLYPLMVILVMILAAVVVLTQVIPQLMEIFEDTANLPLPTRVLMKSSEIVQTQWVLLLSVFILSVGSFLYWKRTRSGGKTWTKVVLSIPVVGEIYRGMILSRFARIFGFLISAGVPIIEVLRLTSKSTNNPLYEEKILLASDDLSRGITIAENIADNEKMFPNIFVKMISIGEKSASTSDIMIKIALYYEELVERTMKRLSTILEPLILIVIACAVVFMILAIYVPILQINELIVQKEG